MNTLGNMYIPLTLTYPLKICVVVYPCEPHLREGWVKKSMGLGGYVGMMTLLFSFHMRRFPFVFLALVLQEIYKITNIFQLLFICNKS